jgi:hypothetical protein
MNQQELEILNALDRAVTSKAVGPKIDAIVARVTKKLHDRSSEPLAWEVIPLDVYDTPLPKSVRSSWVFILRANTTTGAERHPNSHQRMMSYRGSGDFQTKPGVEWQSHPLTSDPSAPLSQRWISIPPFIWHQGVVPSADWVVVSFQTATADELIEERPIDAGHDAVRRRTYASEH